MIEYKLQWYTAMTRSLKDKSTPIFIDLDLDADPDVLDDLQVLDIID
ncbi:MAG: hypothetical protein HRT72_08415 [Flavobacteriales bacterium]|nr:hypothetical protein [Flavobacteriales bacterium]